MTDSDSQSLSGRVSRTCACGCGVVFEVSLKSRKIYFNTKHSQKARDFRKKLRQAGCSDSKEMENKISLSLESRFDLSTY